MNERIRELVERSGIKLIPMIVDGVEYDYEDVEMDGSEDLAKFAELIVEECFKAAMIESKGHLNPIDLVKRMKERVGVEE